MNDSISEFPTHDVDTLFQKGTLQEPDLAQRPSIFTGHALPVKHSDAIPKVPTMDAWFFGLLFMGFVLFAWILSFNAKRLNQLFLATLNINYFQRFRRNGGLFNEPFFLPQLLLSLLVLTLMIYRILDHYYPEHVANTLANQQTPLFLANIAWIVALVLLVKVLLIKVLAWIFKETHAAQTYLFTLFVFNGAGALILLPLLLFAFFSEATMQSILTQSIIVLCAVFLTWRLVRAFFNAYDQSRFPWFHQAIYGLFLELIGPVLTYVILKTVLL